MTDVDRSRIEEKLAFIAGQVSDLCDLARQRDERSFTADPWVVRGAKYALQTSIEAMIDTAYHLAAKAFRYAPDDARDAIDRLVKEGVLPPRWARRLGTWSDFATGSCTGMIASTTSGSINS